MEPSGAVTILIPYGSMIGNAGPGWEWVNVDDGGQEFILVDGLREFLTRGGAPHRAPRPEPFFGVID